MNNYKDKIWPIAKLVIYVINVLATTWLMFKVGRLDMLPTKYMLLIILVVVLLMVAAGVLFFITPKKQGKKPLLGDVV